MMHALVTGATGFIGSHLALRLWQQHWQVKLLVRNPPKLTPALAAAPLIIGDLAGKEALAEAVKDVSVIFHCAANVHTWDSWDAYYTANVQGVRNLLEAIKSHNPKARLVHISTVDVYGFPSIPCTEDSPLPDKGFGYGKSKLMGECLVRDFCHLHNIAYTILRPCNVIGEGSPFITRIGQELQNGLMLKVNGGNSNAGLLYIDTLLDYMLWAAQADAALGQCFNVRDDYDVSWAEFITFLQRKLQGKGWVVSLPFAVAWLAAWCMELPYRILALKREPLLHRLLVCIFGRTCGHHADKIRSFSGIKSTLSFADAMQHSVRSFIKA